MDPTISKKLKPKSSLCGIVLSFTGDTKITYMRRTDDSVDMDPEILGAISAN